MASSGTSKAYLFSALFLGLSIAFGVSLQPSDDVPLFVEEQQDPDPYTIEAAHPASKAVATAAEVSALGEPAPRALPGREEQPPAHQEQTAGDGARQPALSMMARRAPAP